MKIKIIIVEDEPAAQSLLEGYIANISTLELCGIFDNAMTAFDYLLQHQVDIIFLDIKMPQLSGIEFSSSIQGKGVIIFTTAYEEYALKAYEIGAIDYLLKPIRFDRLLAAIQRAVQFLGQSINIESHNNAETTFLIDGVQKAIDLSTLKYIQSFGNYLKIFTVSKMFIATESMKSAEERLKNQQFLRVSRSCMVNVSFIQSYGDRLILSDDTVISIGRTYRRAVSYYLRKSGF